jgi:hypothetical protein
MNSDSPVAASSKTYQKVNRKLAKVAGVPMKHSRFPSEDFEVMTDLLKDRSKERALQYYERALRRGFIEACDALLDGRLELRNGELYCRRKKVVISRKFRFSDRSSETRRFEFKPKDLEFS